MQLQAFSQLYWLVQRGAGFKKERESVAVGVEVRQSPEVSVERNRFVVMAILDERTDHGVAEKRVLYSAAVECATGVEQS